jgi:alpha-mannosidase II
LDLIEKSTFNREHDDALVKNLDLSDDPIEWPVSKKLQVIIVPHSHNEPGWLNTFEQHFEQQTNQIIDTIVNSLSKKKSRTFIWSETSFLSRWWLQASRSMRDKLKRLILETKQLEIVTGGWVMADEANTHFYSMIEQMIEGHEWLRVNIDASLQPIYGWSIDPFGHSPTMAYLLKQMGFEAIVIQQIHYDLKKKLAISNDLEFNWKQDWPPGAGQDNSILTHVMPYIRYFLYNFVQ